MVMFDSSSLIINPCPREFAEGINPPAVFARTKADAPSLLDIAFEAGRTAAMESDFADVLPPVTYGPAEREAFQVGAVEGYRELEWSMEEACRATVTSWSDLDAIEGHGGFLGHDA